MVLKDLVLLPDDQNPRKGNVEEIKKSILENGPFDDIIVQKRHRGSKVPAAKGKPLVLAGNHTAKAFMELGAIRADCAVLDIDDKAANKIIIVSNRLPNLGTIDDRIVAQMLAEMDDVSGTAYTDEQAQELIDAYASAIEEIETAAPIISTIAEEAAAELDEYADDELGIGEEDSEEAEGFGEAPKQLTQQEAPDIDQAEEDDPNSLYTRKDEVIFPSKHPMGFPPLRADMLIEDLPKPLDSWAGSATRDDPRKDVWWLYNYGVDSQSGMNDKARIILCFYTHDEYFEVWWNYPAKKVGQSVNVGVKYAVTPNFSMSSEEPLVLNLYQLYKSRWIGRYMQEAGIRVMPDIQLPAGMDFKALMDKYVKYGLPKPLPWASIQLQAGANAYERDAKMRKEKIAALRYAVQLLEIENLLVYSGTPGKELVEAANLPCGTLWLANRTMKLGEKRKRDRREQY